MSPWRTDIDQILAAMGRGGSFVQQLAVCYRYADMRNKQRLIDAFTDYFQKYDEIAAHLAAREARETNQP